MSTIASPNDPEADPRVKAVFDDIRRTRGSDFINNLWPHLAFDPPLLEEVWAEVKAVMPIADPHHGHHDEHDDHHGKEDDE